MWREACMRVGRREATAVQAACRGGLNCRFGAGARAGAHVEHVGHGCDAGGVEAQRLVERRVLPRVERRAYTVRREVCGSVGGRGRATAAYVAYRREGSNTDMGAGHGEERT